jgi:hypothetical protein
MIHSFRSALPRMINGTPPGAIREASRCVAQSLLLLPPSSELLASSELQESDEESLSESLPDSLSESLSESPSEPLYDVSKLKGVKIDDSSGSTVSRVRRKREAFARVGETLRTAAGRFDVGASPNKRFSPFQSSQGRTTPPAKMSATSVAISEVVMGGSTG